MKSAYRIVPIHPQDHYLFGISWDGNTYVDQALPFGLRSTPKLFTAVADALGWALWVAGIPLHIHYLDDFLLFSPPSGDGQWLPHRALSTFQSLGVPVASQKIEGPATVVTFLGIVIDTVRCELSLPVHKIYEIQDKLRGWLSRRSGPFVEFESLVGHLSHTATVVHQGRTFLRHLYVLLNRVGVDIGMSIWMGKLWQTCSGGNVFWGIGMAWRFSSSPQFPQCMCTWMPRGRLGVVGWHCLINGSNFSGLLPGLRLTYL